MVRRRVERVIAKLDGEDALFITQIPGEGEILGKSE